MLRSVGSLNVGERTSLQLCFSVASGANLLVMDEPTNHLDIPSRERFEEASLSFGGTVLAAVHDRYFIRRCATEVWRIRGSILRTVADV